MKMIDVYEAKLDKMDRKFRVANALINVASVAAAIVTGNITYNLTEDKAIAVGVGVVAGAGINIIAKEELGKLYDDESDERAELLEGFMKTMASDPKQMAAEHTQRCKEYDRILKENRPR